MLVDVCVRIQGEEKRIQERVGTSIMTFQSRFAPDEGHRNWLLTQSVIVNPVYQSL
jgi:hypothetical protein